jgi:hypothetical protein
MLINRSQISQWLFILFLFLIVIIPYPLVYFTAVKIGFNIYITDIILLLLLFFIKTKYVVKYSLYVMMLLFLIIVRALISMIGEDVVLVIREVRPFFYLLLVPILIYILDSSTETFEKRLIIILRIVLLIYIPVQLYFANYYWNPYFRLGSSSWFDIFPFQARGFSYPWVAMIYIVCFLSFLRNKTIFNSLFYLLSCFSVFLNGSRMLFISLVIVTLFYVIKNNVYVRYIYYLFIFPLLLTIIIIAHEIISIINDDRGSYSRRIDEYLMIIDQMKDNVVNFLLGINFGYRYTFFAADAKDMVEPVFVHNSYLMLFSKAGFLIAFLFIYYIIYLFVKGLTIWKPSRSFLFDFGMLYYLYMMLIALTTYTFFQLGDISLLISFSILIFYTKKRSLT